jgi:hypothetical protein
MTGKFRVITIQQLVFCVFFFYFLFSTFSKSRINAYKFLSHPRTHPPTNP